MIELCVDEVNEVDEFDEDNEGIEVDEVVGTVDRPGTMTDEQGGGGV